MRTILTIVITVLVLASSAAATTSASPTYATTAVATKAALQYRGAGTAIKLSFVTDAFCEPKSAAHGKPPAYALFRCWLDTNKGTQTYALSYTAGHPEWSLFSSSKPTPTPKLASKPSTAPASTSPIVRFVPTLEAFYAAILPKVTEMTQNLPGTADANPTEFADGVTAVGNCSSTLSIQLGVVPADSTGTIATVIGQLDQMCSYLSNAALELQLGISGLSPALNDLQQAKALTASISSILGIGNPWP